MAVQSSYVGLSDSNFVEMTEFSGGGVQHSVLVCRVCNTLTGCMDAIYRGACQG